MPATQEKAVLITLFGGTGDLAQRKLYPALFRLFKKGYLRQHFAVIGTARREWSDAYYREIVMQSIASLSDDETEKEEFSSHFYYLSHNVQNTQEYQQLKELASELDKKYQTQQNRVFYLAMAPQFFGTITEHLKTQHLLTEQGFNRLIIEKPFGHNLESAIELNDQLAQTFEETQIYRIDHYLGKEMVQNINAIRFSNIFFEPLWNNKFVDNVQITLSEEVGVGTRAGYYDTSGGALLDMVQNHIFQILSLLIMEPPVQMDGNDVRQEKIKALRSLRAYSPEDVKQNFVRAQYTQSEELLGYLQEDGVVEHSRTETYVAGKLMVDNFRWAGVPFYIRTGKRLANKNTVIHIQFRSVDVNLFHSPTQVDILPDVLTIHIQPSQGMSFNINVKQMGLSNDIERKPLLHYVSPEQEKDIPEAYERLILECLNGNNANFAHRQEVELSWKFIDLVRSAWDNDTSSDLPTYPAGSHGPKEGDDLLARDGFSWHSCDTIYCPNE
ncbi:MULTISPECIES: glucose-6-phosphate dehydrogenase [unclassified Granulicatella]|uniref:glucose-6-phosphate dehydrogenase n=1 Tax=unclassified Granulicatella TaxID=2630493 RepID=UPI0010738670|nr:MULTISPECIES: glucose-6-phosphate dehydrogenase [unclassified Granulicatella]MBF0779880.1 glucose-6-phosphate dehydrogenase [Granulicatella sp. 19428wC4_WM01]TFU96084.1 glucose-6-phosphate dehydrogenase [Granulicatella sp. WM01]